MPSTEANFYVHEKEWLRATRDRLRPLRSRRLSKVRVLNARESGSSPTPHPACIASMYPDARSANPNAVYEQARSPSPSIPTARVIRSYTSHDTIIRIHLDHVAVVQDIAADLGADNARNVPSSRLTIAACEVSPPSSVTMADANLQAIMISGPVVLATSTSPFFIFFSSSETESLNMVRKMVTGPRASPLLAGIPL